MKQILINSEELQTRVAVAENGELEHFFIERKDKHRLSGSVFKGKIKNLEPSLQAAFVDIGTEKNAFLHYWDMLPATYDMLDEVDVDGGGAKSSKAQEQEENQQQQKDSGQSSGNRGRSRGKRKQGMLDRLRTLLRAKEEEADEQKGKKGGDTGGRGRKRSRRKMKESLTVEDIPELFREGQDVMVQVTKGPIGNKGARVTTNLSVPGRYLVLLPNSTHVGVSKRVDNREERNRLRQILRRLEIPDGMGVICRTVGAGRDESQFVEDARMLTETWEKVQHTYKTQRAPCCVYREPGLAERCLRDFLTDDIDEVVTDSQEEYDCANELVKRLSRQERVRVKPYRSAKPLFAKYGLTEQVENIFRRQVQLPSGGYICIDETEALIAIDVNSGRNRKGKDHPETILTTNLEAVHEVARQLRLRNIGGLIVIDFIDMRSKKDQAAVYKAMRDELAHDRARTRVCQISPLGLIEMTRQRQTESLRSTVYSPCPYCEGKGLVKSSTSMSVEIQRRLQEILRRHRKTVQLRVIIHPSILERLKNEDAELLEGLEEDFGGELSFRGDPALHMEEFRIINVDSGAEM